MQFGVGRPSRLDIPTLGGRRRVKLPPDAYRESRPGVASIRRGDALHATESEAGGSQFLIGVATACAGKSFSEDRI